LRRALASITSQPATARELSYPALDAAREFLDQLDATIDRIARAAAANETHDVLSRELALAAEAHRLERTLAVAFDALGPPASRARAALIDMLRANHLGAMRREIYAFLVSRDTDIRIPLADEPDLSLDARLDLLGLYAQRIRARGRRIAPAFEGVRPAPLLRALADWTRHASHPRQIVFAFERAARDGETARAVIERLEPRTLPIEVSHWLDSRTKSGPVMVVTHALGVGHYECAQCGADALLATSTRRIDEHGRRATETRFACRACGTSHHASWDDDSLVRDPIAPSAWIETG
jgi:hypothetical protein